ncbi:hypothetical protein BBF96_13910 [Anoxybacter fermentans]|uniref:Radical SAM core domain-containing protein n=1 Tax=Anoxybacter fermentans TaxID=1323375 RepID=A0A3Q9HS64_9FIRM|nr:radical SAM protein [Anoxybacter fermentans]AZR74385.1 hypothetical protein BBF96_13910 [Anoxybacter fermentans]
MNKRYIIRKEGFGGLVHDKGEFNLFCVDDFGYEIIKRIYEFGVEGMLHFYHNDSKEVYTNILEYVDILKENDVINQNYLNGSIIEILPTKNALSAPVKVFLSITDYCNLKCKHCFGDYGQGSQMSFDRVAEIVQQLKEVGVFEVSLTGGEPLLHPDLYKIIELLIDSGINIQICTNGTVITDEFIDIVKQYKNHFLRLSISIDGIPEVHDRIRGTGTYNKIMSNIKILQKHNIDFGFNLVLNNLNVWTIKEFLNIMYDRGIHRGSFSPIKPVGRAKNTSLNFRKGNKFNTDWKEMVINEIKNFAHKTGNNQFLYGHLITPEGKVTQPVGDNLMGFLQAKRCGAGIINASIAADGKVLPCTFLSEVFKKREIPSESVFNKNFKEIWDKNEQFLFMRTLEIGSKCKYCEEY